MGQLYINELYHYGIPGQKWGVRNGPPYPLDKKNYSSQEKKAAKNKSLDRTTEYYRKRVKRELRYADDVNRIVDTLSPKEKRLLGMKKNEKKWFPDDGIARAEMASNIAKTFIQYDGKKPVAFLEIWDNGTNTGEIVIATDPQYRGTGITRKNIQKAKRWFNGPANLYLTDLQWNNRKENAKSGQIAARFGFGELEEDELWEYRVIRRKELGKKYIERVLS